MKHESSRTLSALARPDFIDCEDAEIFVSRRIDGELTPADLALLKAHLKGCASCRAQAEAWAETSCVLVDSISTLWTDESDAAAAPRELPVMLPTPKRGAYWLPLGMLASQAVAILGLCAYLFVFAPHAEAPRITVHANDAAPTRLAPLSTEQHHAVEVEIVASIEPAPPVLPAPAPAPLPKLAELLASGPVETVVVALNDESPQTIALAAPLPPVPLKPVSHVSMDFQIGDQCGRLTLLGDILSGKAVIRVSDASGHTQVVAQQDIDTLPPGQRAAVRRFLAACAEPALRERFEELRK